MFMDGEEWPQRTDFSEDAWVDSIQLLESVHDRFVEAIRGLRARRWPEPWLSTSYYQFIHGMLHHLVYHTAQIAILKKDNHNR